MSGAAHGHERPLLDVCGSGSGSTSISNLGVQVGPPPDGKSEYEAKLQAGQEGDPSDMPHDPRTQRIPRSSPPSSSSSSSSPSPRRPTSTLRLKDVWHTLGPRSRFFCNGACITGPEEDLPYKVCASGWIFLSSVAFLSVCGPDLWRSSDGLWFLPLCVAVLLVTTFVLLALTACTDPGILPPRRVLERCAGLEQEVLAELGFHDEGLQQPVTTSPLPTVVRWFVPEGRPPAEVVTENRNGSKNKSNSNTNQSSEGGGRDRGMSISSTTTAASSSERTIDREGAQACQLPEGERDENRVVQRLRITQTYSRVCNREACPDVPAKRMKKSRDEVYGLAIGVTDTQLPTQVFRPFRTHSEKRDRCFLVLPRSPHAEFQGTRDISISRFFPPRVRSAFTLGQHSVVRGKDSARGLLRHLSP